MGFAPHRALLPYKDNEDIMSDKEIQIIEGLKEDVEEMLDLLKGKDGNDGIIAKVNRHEQWITRKDRDFYGIYNFVFRTLLSITLGYIAYKVGISP